MKLVTFSSLKTSYGLPLVTNEGQYGKLSLRLNHTMQSCGSGEVLGQQVGNSGAVIGRYEPEEITPSMEMANKIAGALGVSLDYLVCNTDLELTDNLMKRIKEVSIMNDKDKDYFYTLIDAFIAKTKLQGLV